MSEIKIGDTVQTEGVVIDISGGMASVNSDGVCSWIGLSRLTKVQSLDELMKEAEVTVEKDNFGLHKIIMQGIHIRSYPTYSKELYQAHVLGLLKILESYNES